MKRQSCITKIRYSDTTPSFVGSVPPKSVLLGAYIFVSEAFNASTTNTISLGNISDSDYFASAIDVSSAGRNTLTLTNANGIINENASTGLYASYTKTGDTPTAGEAYIVLEFVQM